MKRKIALSLLAGLGLSAFASAQEAPMWVRQTALSPDGRTIAFTYKGDIFTVPVSGGRATQITSNPSYDTAPVWSPDSKNLAFASDREGAMNVYLTTSQGGQAKRLTFNSSSEIPVAFDGNHNVIYRANIRPAKEVGLFPTGVFSQLYTIPVTGGRAKMFSAITMEEPSIRDGKILYTDRKGYEDPFRKHHTSSVTRDIWLYSKDGGYKKITSFVGEDRNAQWVANEDAFYYTSEQDGTLNIYKRALAGGKDVQLTTFKHHPVRYMSADRLGNLSFSWNGELYYMPVGGQPRKVDIEIVADYTTPEVQHFNLSSGLSSMALSPDNKEIAMVVRGEVYVTSVDYKTTKRITNTPQQERNITFSPDGRKIVYASERNGKWDLFMTELVRKDDKSFTYARELKETQLTDSPYPSFDPKFSPDGKEIAFLRDRSAIVVLNLATSKERLVKDKVFDYSYSDGDQWFEWSPDSKWIITNYIGVGGWNNKDVAIFKADGSGTVHNLTESGYSDIRGRFVLGGKAVLFSSDRSGYRSHGSWGAERDIYLMFLDREAYDQFIRSKEERELAKTEISDVDKKKEDEKSADKNKKSKAKKDDKEKKTEKPLVFQLEDRDYLTVRLTRTSGMQTDYVIEPKGEILYYIGLVDNAFNLYEINLVEGSTKVLIPNIGPGSLLMGKNGTTLFVATSAGIKKIDGTKQTPVTFSAPYELRKTQEREYIYRHMVQQVQDKFYDVNLHGVDWAMYSANYGKFLPYINNNYDFAELMSEILGELNASHTGARYGAPVSAQITASLGLFYDESYIGDGLKIAEVMPGSPLKNAASNAKPGAIIESIDGEKILRNVPIEHYFNGKVGKRVLLTIKNPSSGKVKVGKHVLLTIEDTKSGKVTEEYVRLISQSAENGLLYRRWVEKRAEMVNKWSDGRIAYIHIQGMNSPSFRKMYKELLGKYRHCDAVIVDTRFNGGGWLHEDLAILLSGKVYSRFTPRGTYIGSDPFAQWTKPSAVLMSEGNYSNAHGFPYVYKTLGLGKLIGAPVPGTMTAVWWESQIDPTLVFGIPQVTCSDLDGKPLENVQLEPDVLVYNTPEQYLVDDDQQLRAAVKTLQEQLNKK